MQTAVVLGACLTACASAGTVAGLDAVRHVDGVYTTSRPFHNVARPVTPASSPLDWNESPVAAAPSPGLPDQAGAAERAFFDTGDSVAVTDEPIEPARVRVHRPRRAVEPVMLDAQEEAPVVAASPDPDAAEPAPTT